MARRGMKIGPCAVTMKEGSLFTGKILEKALDVSMDAEHSSTIALKSLAWIWFRNDYGYKRDHLQFLSGSELYCDVLTKKLTIKTEDFGEVSLLTSKILTVQFLDI